MTQEEALAWIVQLFEEAPDRISLATPRTDVPAWDSLGVLSLMAGLDETFGIVANGAELNRMQSVGEILEMLRTHGKVSN
jgi:acyl carrier protein